MDSYQGTAFNKRDVIGERWGLGEASLRDLPQCRARIRQEGLEGRQERVKADLLVTGGH